MDNARRGQVPRAGCNRWLVAWAVAWLLSQGLGVPGGLLGQAPSADPRVHSEADTGAGSLPHPDDEGLTTRQRFEALLARAEQRQTGLETLEATFEQRKEGPLLVESEMSRGTVVYRAPDLVRWDFDPPASTTVLVGNEEVVTWYRDQGVAERRRVGDAVARSVQILGPGASLETLQGYFDMTASFPDDPAEPYRLVLEPRIRRVERRLRSLELRIDRKLFVPVFVRIEEATGATTELRFEDLQLNGEIPVARFELDLPAGVEIRDIGRPD